MTLHDLLVKSSVFVDIPHIPEELKTITLEVVPDTQEQVVFSAGKIRVHLKVKSLDKLAA